MKFEDLKIGMKESVSKTITETDVILYAGITLDVNPVSYTHLTLPTT